MIDFFHLDMPYEALTVLFTIMVHVSKFDYFESEVSYRRSLVKPSIRDIVSPHIHYVQALLFLATTYKVLPVAFLNHYFRVNNDR